MKILKFMLLVVVTSILFKSCKAEPLEGDEEAPVIEIISPIDNEVFYTNNSVISTNSIQIQAKATDNNAVVFGILTITDEEGDLVDADVESNFSENNKVLELTADFTPDNSGIYSLNFLFRDANDNNASTSITIEFKEGTEEEGKAITMQLYGSDRAHETVIRVDFYDDDSIVETVLARDVIDAQAMTLNVPKSELMFGSTQTGLDIDVFSMNTIEENLITNRVSDANYLFGALAKDYTQQTVYYFLDGADLTKVGNHRLYKMDADGSNQTLLTQVDNATRANAIDKILVSKNSEAPLLYMHDRNSVYAYNPDIHSTLKASTIYFSKDFEIHDLAIDYDNEIFYMILSYYKENGKHYTVATKSFNSGLSEINLSFASIAENSPVTSIFYPHRMKLDIENQQVYWFTESEDLQKSILKSSKFNATSAETLWETNTCLCIGEVEDIRIEDYVIHIP
ncbi:hypothetical protein [uncultured Algibacter sp.]|uniref:hypothetical protein n=1 Tax=uncultured Algibacter sp. TaxID=298659 RepID=UPI0026136041|nr:hypothetical protein [uncultured Algibacter sp.]